MDRLEESGGDLERGRFVTELFSGPVGAEILGRMVFGFFAAVAGITLWAHTREPAWILVITATLLGYVEVLLRFLSVLGVVILDAWTWEGIPLVRTAFAVIVPLLYTLGLWGAVRSFHRP